jgi:hypothetical protein
MRRLQGDFHKSLVGHFRAVSKASLNIKRVELRVLLENLLRAHTRCQQVKDQRDPDAVSADARLTKAPLRIDPDPLQELLTRHVVPSFRAGSAGLIELWQCVGTLEL